MLNTAFLAYCVFFCVAYGATPLSQYGQIQNVQTYSNNPFYKSNGGYNQKSPQAIYATGAALSTVDCQTTVATLVAAHCALNNNCVGTQLSDVRPTLMLQLSQIPGYNYATSCAGFIDGAYNDFMKRHGAGNNVKIPTPFPTQQQDNYTAVSVPNNTMASGLKSGGLLSQSAGFPKTESDLSLADRIAVKAEGYEPFKDFKAYKDLVVVGEEYYSQRQVALAQQEQQQDSANMTDAEYCNKYPLDSSRCPQNANSLQNVINVGNVSYPQFGSGTDLFNGKTIGGSPVVVQNGVMGGSCFPAAKSDWFKNKVMTTGQYEKISPAFEKAMITVFRKEGKCGTTPGDKCGYTCYGLGSGPACMNMDVSKLTRADAEKIYYDRWWKAYNLDRLPDVIAGDVFLACMASGPKTAISQFRQFLNLPKGYKIDDSVVNAVKNYQGDIHNDWLNVRQEFLTKVAAKTYQNSVLKGWMNAVKLKRENGCHVVPKEPLFRQ